MQVEMARRSFMNDPHCGDRCGFREVDGTHVLYMIDGLGHGKNAEVAALAAEEFVVGHLRMPLEEMFEECDRAIAHTRGVALGVAVVDPAARTLTFAGINNTRVRVLRRRQRQAFQISSDPGIVGGGFRTLVPATVDFGDGDIALMFTDGVSDRMDVSQYRDEQQQDLQQWAEQILDDWERTNDDRTVLICQHDGS